MLLSSQSWACYLAAQVQSIRVYFLARVECKNNRIFFKCCPSVTSSVYGSRAALQENLTIDTSIRDQRVAKQNSLLTAN